VEIFGKLITLEQDGNFEIGEEVEAVIRPEAVDLVEVNKGDINGEVRFSHYTGSIATYEIKLENGEEMEVVVANPREKGFLKKGDRVGISLHRQSLYLLKE